MLAAAKAELDHIAREVAVCTKCALCKTRTNTVPGEGHPQASLLFIGEAPGYNEDMQGRPFVGNSGQLLERMFKALNFTREDVFIANVVKCRPPQNQDPTDEQITACKEYLDRQIAAINPRVIVTLGRFSMRRYWPGQYISKVHGQPKQENGRIVMPMFHPSYVLRDQSPTKRALALFKEDAMTIPDLLIQAEELARKELWGQPVSPAPPVVVEPVPVSPVEDIGVDELLKDGSSEAGETPALTSELGEIAKDTAPVKPARLPRKPKTVAEPGPETVAALASAGNQPVPASRLAALPRRKKRPPLDGEQLTMF